MLAAAVVGSIVCSMESSSACFCCCCLDGSLSELPSALGAGSDVLASAFAAALADEAIFFFRFFFRVLVFRGAGSDPDDSGSGLVAAVCNESGGLSFVCSGLAAPTLPFDPMVLGFRLFFLRDDFSIFRVGRSRSHLWLRGFDFECFFRWGSDPAGFLGVLGLPGEDLGRSSEDAGRSRSRSPRTAPFGAAWKAFRPLVLFFLPALLLFSAVRFGSFAGFPPAAPWLRTKAAAARSGFRSSAPSVRRRLRGREGPAEPPSRPSRGGAPSRRRCFPRPNAGDRCLPPPLLPVRRAGFVAVSPRCPFASFFCFFAFFAERCVGVVGAAEGASEGATPRGSERDGVGAREGDALGGDAKAAPSATRG